MDKHLGMGVMINMLSGNEESAKAFTSCIGKRIGEAKLEGDNTLLIKFDTGETLRLVDDGQSCCESRYMRTDDDLAYFTGAIMTGGQIKEAPSLPCEYGDHEVQFLEIQTDKGVFTMSNHNEHNGYYGGFLIRAHLE